MRICSSMALLFFFSMLSFAATAGDCDCDTEVKVIQNGSSTIDPDFRLKVYVLQPGEAIQVCGNYKGNCGTCTMTVIHNGTALPRQSRYLLNAPGFYETVPECNGGFQGFWIVGGTAPDPILTKTSFKLVNQTTGTVIPPGETITIEPGEVLRTELFCVTADEEFPFLGRSNWTLDDTPIRPEIGPRELSEALYENYSAYRDPNELFDDLDVFHAFEEPGTYTFEIPGAEPYSFKLAHPWTEPETADGPAQLYPNPVDDQLMLHFTDTRTRQVTFRIYSLSGALVQSGTADFLGNSLRIGLEGSSSGTYLLETQWGDQRLTQKFVRQ